jgi:hypothetical protein
VVLRECPEGIRAFPSVTSHEYNVECCPNLRASL